MTVTSDRIQTLDTKAWSAAWAALPAPVREVYGHPGFSQASGHREDASPECLLLDLGERRMLYPFLRHAVTGYDGILKQPVSDIQSAYGYGGPVFTGAWSTAECVEALSLTAAALRETGAVAEFVRCHTEWCPPEVMEAAGYATMRVRTNVECDLAGDFESSWHGTARRNLRRARASGLVYRCSAEPADWQDFTRLYALTFDRARMADGYRFDDAYFQVLAALPATLWRLIVVDAPGLPAVAGAVLFLGGRLAHYHLGASDLRHGHLRPNDFLYWAMATEAKQSGCERIVWGGGLTTDPEDGLFKFKQHFGTIRRDVFVAGRALDAEVFGMLNAEWDRRNSDRAAAVRRFLRYRA